jgi:Holliday junction resolvase RusA-like endonuclease
MDLLLEFDVIGFEPCPWRAPEHGSGVTRTGKRYHFCRIGGKSDIANGRVNLKKWQKIVADEASKAMSSRPAFRGPIQISMNFYYKAPEPELMGEIAWLPMKPSKKTGKLSKPTLKGRTLPDIINLFKGTEDAMKGIVFVDDVQTRAIGPSAAVFCWHSGVHVKIHSMGEQNLETIQGERVGNEDAGGRVRRQPRRKKPRNSPGPVAVDPE